MTGYVVMHGVEARLAQPAERKALNLVVVGSSPTAGVVASVRLSWAPLRSPTPVLTGSYAA